MIGQDRGAVPRSSTKFTLQSKLSLFTLQSKFDGAEIGSTDKIDEWSYRDISAVTANKLYNCK